VFHGYQYLENNLKAKIKRSNSSFWILHAQIFICACVRATSRGGGTAKPYVDGRRLRVRWFCQNDFISLHTCSTRGQSNYFPPYLYDTLYIIPRATTLYLTFEFQITLGRSGGAAAATTTKMKKKERARAKLHSSLFLFANVNECLL